MNPLSEESRKRLTEYIGECFHEKLPWQEVRPGQPSIVCSCGERFALNTRFDRHVFELNRTFTTGNDMLALKEKLVEKGDWKEFEAFAFTKTPDGFCIIVSTFEGDWCYPSKFSSWLFTIPRFAELVDEFFKEKKGT